MLYQDENLYYLRKPAWVPSTRWKQECFLDMLVSWAYERWLAHPHHSAYHKNMQPYLVEHIAQQWLKKVEEVHATVHSLLHTFSRAQEYGLVNRLDTPTSGFLYFAKSVSAYIDHKLHQKEDRLIKHYIAKVDGHVAYLFDHGHEHDEIEIENDLLHIRYPLMHHVHLQDRMTVLIRPEHRTKWRWDPLFKKTTLRIVDYDIPQNKTLIHITISAGARHQIRAHLWALWYPILWDTIYTKRKTHTHMPLHLWSIGCELRDEE